jgi:hypothetical protein
MHRVFLSARSTLDCRDDNWQERWMPFCEQLFRQRPNCEGEFHAAVACLKRAPAKAWTCSEAGVLDFEVYECPVIGDFTSCIND